MRGTLTLHGSISGTFFYDTNGNGIWDSGEPTSPLWYVYIDSNDDGMYDAGDILTRADSNGHYSFTGLTATRHYTIRAATASGWQQTYPAGGDPQVVLVGESQTVSGINFGERRIG